MKAEIGGMHLQARVPEIASKPLEARGQAGKSFPPSEGANPADNLILDLSPSELHKNKHLMLKHYISLTLLWWM